MVELLKVPFSKEEIRQELMGDDSNKASSLDKFTSKFAQTFWKDLKGELVSLLDQFFELTEFDHRFSSSSISLIPKVSSPSNLNDFRPISLLG